MDHNTLKKLAIVRNSQALQQVSPLQLYLQEIAKYPLLEPEEEYDLAKKHYENKDIKAAHRLITSNLRLVVKIANEFRRSQTNLLDLIQEGNYGLMQAVKRFNPYKGVKLSSYAAWWIRAYILKYLLDNQGQVKIATTAVQRKLFYNLKKETDRLLSAYDTADSALIADSLDVPERDVLEMQKRLSGGDISLDALVSGEDGDQVTTHGDLMFDRNQVSAEDLLSDAQVKTIFSQYLGEFKEQLSGRDLEVFETRIMSEKPLTLQELGDKYQISRERARQIEARIIKRLKDFVSAKGTLDIN